MVAYCPAGCVVALSMPLGGRQQDVCKGIFTLMLQNLWKLLFLSNCKIGQFRKFCTCTQARLRPYLNKPANFDLIGSYERSATWFIFSENHVAISHDSESKTFEFQIKIYLSFAGREDKEIETSQKETCFFICVVWTCPMKATALRHQESQLL